MSVAIASVIDKVGLKPSYILILFIFSIFTMEFVLRMAADAGLIPREGHFRSLAVRVGAIAIGFAIFSCFRELRSATVVMFRVSTVPVIHRDLLLALAVAYTWCIGVHQAVVAMPTVFLDPAYFLRFWGILDVPRRWSLENWLLLTLTFCVVTPILEEVFFRGLLLNAWRARRSLLASVLLSSAVFGITHGNTSLLAFGLGVVLSLVYLRYGSLWPAIAIHGAYNLLQLTPALAPLSQRKVHSEASSLAAWTFEILLAIAFVPLAVVFWRRFRPA